MDNVLIVFGLLQLAKAVAAAILTLRTHLSIRVRTEKEYNHGRSLLKAIALFSLAGLLIALYWEMVIFGNNVFPYRSLPNYRWGLLVLAVMAEAPFFMALRILWQLMDAVNGIGKAK